jgi:hypothetical protein
VQLAQKDDKKPPDKPLILTRILAANQLKRKNIGINTVRRSVRSLRRNLPKRFSPSGKNTGSMSGLYMYMRRYGGAGMMGFHRDSETGRVPVVRGILDKMRNDRTTRSSRGPKFAMIAIDASRLPTGTRVHDLTSGVTKRSFHRDYYKYRRMYKTHEREGVVAIEGEVPRSAVVAMRAFRGTPNEEEMQEIIDQLVAGEEEEQDIVEEPGTPDDTPGFQGFRDNDRDPDGGAMGQEVY